jgi:DNA invertase Pin-like site-specific DNA recombinase
LDYEFAQEIEMGKKTGVPAVAYLRMSSGKQEASIPDQRKAVARFAVERGFTVIREYCDEGISGDDTEKRIQFRRMISDAATGEFRAILCWDQDRFGRFDPIEAGRWIAPLRDAEVRLVTIGQGEIDWCTFAGRIAWTVQQEAKHGYLRDLSRNVGRGHVATALRGDWNGGTPPLGYVLVQKSNRKNTLALDDSGAADLVIRIFREYLQGESLRAIASKLTNEKIPTSTGGKSWNPNSVRTILNNPLYTGDYSWNRVSRARYSRIVDGQPEEVMPRGKGQINDSDQRIAVKDNHPAIIDRETFERVQRRLAERKPQTTPCNVAKFLLTGLLRCGHCGNVMYGDSKTAGYLCNGYRSRGRSLCQCYSVKEDQLVEILLGAIQERLLSPECRRKLLREVERRVRNRGTHRDEAPQLRKALRDIEGRIVQARRRLVEVESDLLGEVQCAIRELLAQKKSIEDKLDGAIKQARDDDPSQQSRRLRTAMKRLKELPEVIRTASPRLAREALSRTINRVELRFQTEVLGKSNRHHLAGGTMYLSDSVVSELSSASSRDGSRG